MLLARGLKKMGYGKYSTYPLIGILPGEFQNKLAEDVGFSPWAPSIVQITLCLGVNLGAWGLGDNLNGEITDYFGMGLKGFAYASQIGDFMRIGYMAIKKKAIGPLWGVEIPWRVFRRYGKTRGKYEKLIEKYILN